MEMTLYSMRSWTLSQCKDCKIRSRLDEYGSRNVGTVRRVLDMLEAS